MAQIRKYANLPDIDTAPDLYETPELTDDNSTYRTSTARSPSPSEEGSADGPVDRQGLPFEQASSRFSHARVDARGVDFSDRVINSGRAGRSYRTRSRRRRRDAEEEDSELGDFSDEEDETLERKLARLRREVEEVKAAYEERKEATSQPTGAKDEGSKDDEGEDGDPAAHITRLSDTLDAVHAEQHARITGAEAQFAHSLQRFANASIADSPTPAPAPAAAARAPQHAHTLAKAAEFDSRLAALERALGLDGTSMPESAPKPPKPILHALSALDAQLAAVSAATASPAFEGVARQVRQLASEADRVAEARKGGGDDDASSPTSSEGDGEAAKAYLADADRVAKINALYGTLGTIDSLAPTLPLVLERLRTLRLVHASAGGAAGLLDALDERSEEQTKEIKMWRESLAKLEAAVQSGEETTAKNVATVGEWVRELEARAGKL